MVGIIEEEGRVAEFDPGVTSNSAQAGEGQKLAGELLAIYAAQEAEPEKPAEIEPTKEEKRAQAEAWLAAQGGDQVSEGTEIPVGIAGEVSVIAQQQMNELEDDGIIDDEYYALKAVRDKAAEAAEELDFQLVAESGTDWAFRVRLNGMHDKFKDASPEALEAYLGHTGRSEIKALHIRDIVADHAPDLLTEDLKTIMDPSQPLWRASSAHARILLRNKPAKNLGSMPVREISGAKPLAEMGEADLGQHAQPESVSAIKERGYALYPELNQAAQEDLLTQAIYETVVKSGDPASKEAASGRNRASEDEPMVRRGDLVHATDSPEILELILADGLRCGEAITTNDSDVIKYPFTVSFLEVTKDAVDSASAVEAFAGLKNESYGAINIVMEHDEAAMEAGVPNQRQIFGGKPSTEIKGIVIRDGKAGDEVAQKVIQAVVKNGMFIPVYRGSTGGLLLDAEQFDRLVTAT